MPMHISPRSIPAWTCCFIIVNQAYSLEPLQHPSFLAGRAGSIVSDGKQVGVIGELHPEVLERWQIGVPAVAFEIDLTDCRTA